MELLTTSEAAKLLRVSEDTILREIHRGKLPAWKVGHQFRILRSAVDEYVRGPSPVTLPKPRRKK
jgi:excisionase family DNA binding protein